MCLCMPNMMHTCSGENVNYTGDKTVYTIHTHTHIHPHKSTTWSKECLGREMCGFSGLLGTAYVLTGIWNKQIYTFDKGPSNCMLKV